MPRTGLQNSYPSVRASIRASSIPKRSVWYLHSNLMLTMSSMYLKCWPHGLQNLAADNSDNREEDDLTPEDLSATQPLVEGALNTMAICKLKGSLDVLASPLALEAVQFLVSILGSRNVDCINQLFGRPSPSPLPSPSLGMQQGWAWSAIVDIHLFSELSSQYIEIPNYSR